MHLKCNPLTDYSQRIVEANPRKFNLDATELGVRKAFITSTRQVVRVSL